MAIFTSKVKLRDFHHFWRPAKIPGNVPEQIWGQIWAQGGLFTQVGAGFDHISKDWPRGNFWKTKNVKPDLEIFHPKSKNVSFSTFLKCDQNPQKRPKANLRPDMGRGESG